jgi:hypothetical protein
MVRRRGGAVVCVLAFFWALASSGQAGSTGETPDSQLATVAACMGPGAVPAEASALDADVAGASSGAANPERIPLYVAYRLFLRSLAPPATDELPGPEAPEIAAAARGWYETQLFASFRLTEAEAARFRAVVDGFGAKVRELDRRAAVIKDRAWPDPGPDATAELAALQRENDNLVRQVMRSLAVQVGAGAAHSIDSHVRDQVRRLITIVPGPLAPPADRAASPLAPSQEALGAAAAPLEAQSCGEIGGDWCSQTGSCPAGRHSLGRTSDCNPCCRTNEPSGPSCGELGGNYCSQTSSCPAGYASLGTTWDCTRCCLRGGPSMSGVYYRYSNGGTNFSYIWARGITSSDYNTYGHQFRAVTTLTSPHGRSATVVSGRSTSYSEAFASIPFDPTDTGEYTIVTQHFEMCPYVNQEWSIGTTSRRMGTGISTSCWSWGGYTDTDGSGHVRCVYTLPNGNTPGCATCVPNPGVPKIHLDKYGYCPPSIDWEVPWFRIAGPAICSPVGNGTADYSSCLCSDR